ncbi:MAG TPA: alpha/beta hydrolase [Gaiellales bacterium]|nr:alpha/beta hydrolase [Gaiellales bacterium]
MAERMVSINGVEICTEPFGDPSDPPVLLMMGVAGSMLWWDEAFCAMLAGRGRYVIRYDPRDTGRSTTYEVGRPGYGGADLVADAAGVLDGYGIAAAHVVGVSAGGALAQVLAIDHPERVLSLVLISTSFAAGGDRSPLPGPSEELSRFWRTPQPGWADLGAVADHLVAYLRVLTGGRRPFDEPFARELVRRDMERARNYPAVQNHELLEGARPSRAVSAISAPTLVVHGTADPMFPPAHGEALASAIPGARLLLLDDAGHGVEPADWETLAGAIADHTAG